MLVFVGAGNLATCLASAFHKKGEPIELVWSRTETSARTLAEQVGARWTTDLADVPPEADVVIYAVKDSCLARVLAQVRAPKALHLHTAGSMGMEVFSPDLHPRCGVFYPFQTFSKAREVDFSGIPVFLETSSAGDMQDARSLAEKVTSEVYTADSATRRSLHLAGVFANNFSNCMFAIAAEQLAKAGLPQKVLLPLIDETAAKVHTLPAAEAQTGPARRNDKDVMQKHLAMLTPELQQIYNDISDNILQRCGNTL